MLAHVIGRRLLRLLPLCLIFGAAAAVAEDTIPPSVSEIPETFTPRTESFDFVERDEMIAMRDGVALHTIILVPKGAQAAPMLLVRTPYSASKRTSRFPSSRMAAVVPQMLDTAVEAGYIVVYQDVRGKHGSEGDYVMNRPLRGPLNPTGTDHATDTYDTIDWLVKNVPESNGRVGTIGGSYEGFTVFMSTVRPHPALKVAVPFAAMVDGWMGDDWFHNGAFRHEGALEFTYNQQATRKSTEEWWSDTYDTYDAFLRVGSAGAMAASRGLDQTGFWRQLAAHPNYDAWWQLQAMDKVLAQQPLTVPMLIVGSLFDQEDIYGSPAVYRALAPKDPEGRLVHLVLGPWNHGQGRGEGRGIGPVKFDGDTATWFRRNVMQPFLDHYLKDAPKPDTPRVLAYETGADEWHRYDHWPRACAEGCASRSRDLYLLADGSLGFERPSESRDRQRAELDLQHGQIRVGIDADQRGGRFARVAQLDAHLGGAGDDVIRGHDVAAHVVDDARTEAALDALAVIRPDFAEQLPELRRQARDARHDHAPLGVDVDHRGRGGVDGIRVAHELRQGGRGRFRTRGGGRIRGCRRRRRRWRIGRLVDEHGTQQHERQRRGESDRDPRRDPSQPARDARHSRRGLRSSLSRRV